VALGQFGVQPETLGGKKSKQVFLGEWRKTAQGKRGLPFVMKFLGNNNEDERPPRFFKKGREMGGGKNQGTPSRERPLENVKS